MPSPSKANSSLLFRAIGRLLWIVALILGSVELFSFILPQDLTRSTATYSRLVQISFFGRVLSFHAGLIMGVVALSAIAARRTRLATLAFCSFLILLAENFHATWSHSPDVANGQTLRLMSMNLKDAVNDAGLITGQIAQFDPDVLLLEDYTPFVQAAIEARFARVYQHRYLLPDTLQGLAIFSRSGFNGRPRLTFSKTRRQLRAVINCGNQPIVIYAEHPYSPRSAARIINNRLSTVDLAQQVMAETLPVIAAGDFNFTAETPNEQLLKSSGLQDAFDTAGHGLGSTWPEKPTWLQWLPGVRIDHIFCSAQLTCTRFEVGKYDGSDHLPIVAEIRMRH